MTGFYIKERTDVRSEGLAAVAGFEPTFGRRVWRRRNQKMQKSEKGGQTGVKNET